VPNHIGNGLKKAK